MKTNLPFFFLLAILCQYAVHAQVGFTKQALLSDLDNYKNCIIQNDVDPFTKISKQEFMDGVGQIKEHAGSKNTDELVMELKELNAKLGDEHSNIVTDIKSEKTFPIQCYWFDEGLFIIKTDTANSKIRFLKIVAINNIPISTIAEKMARSAPNRNPGAVKKYVSDNLPIPWILHGLNIIDNVDSATFTLEGKDEKTSFTLHAVARKDFFPRGGGKQGCLLRYRRAENYWCHYDTRGFIYFKYNSAVVDPNNSMQEFQADFFALVKHHTDSKIIIDLRDNSGGERALIQPFILELSKQEGINKKKICILTGRKTFSAALNNIYDFAKLVKITTVGEPTGASINHLGRVKEVRLLNTGLHVSYSTHHIINVPGAEGPYMPDVLVPKKFSDYLSCFDAALEYAIAH